MKREIQIQQSTKTPDKKQKKQNISKVDQTNQTKYDVNGITSNFLANEKCNKYQQHKLN